MENTETKISSVNKVIKKKKGSNGKMELLKLISSVAILLALGGGIYYVHKNGLPSFMKSASQNQNLTEDQIVLAQLKKIILLPDDITPTMAVVTNADILKKQQPGFFADVKNGDRLILYPDLAIIYDFVANKIIKVGPVQNAPPQTNK